MMDALGDRQQDLLKLLLKKHGMTADEISSDLGITRPATRQHLVALARQGYVERGELLTTGGRPGQTYRLTPKGYELFPKQYSWFSEILLESLNAQLGSGGLKDFMRRLGAEIGEQAAPKVPGKTLKTKVEETAKLLNDLAFQAETALTGKELPGEAPVIEASNCVYHSLARKFPEICEFDISLLSRLTDAQVIHEQCIVRGGGTCRFRFKAKRAK